MNNNNQSLQPTIITKHFTYIQSVRRRENRIPYHGPPYKCNAKLESMQRHFLLRTKGLPIHQFRPQQKQHQNCQQCPCSNQMFAGPSGQFAWQYEMHFCICFSRTLGNAFGQTSTGQRQGASHAESATSESAFLLTWCCHDRAVMPFAFICMRVMESSITCDSSASSQSSSYDMSVIICIASDFVFCMNPALLVMVQALEAWASSALPLIYFFCMNPALLVMVQALEAWASSRQMTMLPCLWACHYPSFEKSIELSWLLIPLLPCHHPSFETSIDSLSWAQQMPHLLLIPLPCHHPIELVPERRWCFQMVVPERWCLQMVVPKRWCFHMLDHRRTPFRIVDHVWDACVGSVHQHQCAHSAHNSTDVHFEHSWKQCSNE